MEMVLDEGEPIHFIGRIAFCAQVEEEGRTVWHMGIEFLEMQPADRERLDAFIKVLATR